MSATPHTEEDYLRWELRNLQYSYERAAKPLIDRLVRIESMKQRSWIIDNCDAMAALAASHLYTSPEPAKESQKIMHENGERLQNAADYWQVCAASVKNDNKQLREALRRIAGLDPEIDSLHGFNEWGKSDCFKQAQLIAKKSLDAHPGDGEQQASKLTRQEKVGMTELEQLSAEEALAKKALVANKLSEWELKRIALQFELKEIAVQLSKHMGTDNFYLPVRELDASLQLAPNAKNQLDD